jgi:hypothetical protein
MVLFTRSYVVHTFVSQVPTVTTVRKIGRFYCMGPRTIIFARPIIRNIRTLMKGMIGCRKKVSIIAYIFYLAKSKIILRSQSERILFT